MWGSSCPTLGNNFIIGCVDQSYHLVSLCGVGVTDRQTHRLRALNVDMKDLDSKAKANRAALTQPGIALCRPCGVVTHHIEHASMLDTVLELKGFQDMIKLVLSHIFEYPGIFGLHKLGDEN